ncbi:FecR family protein [Chitinophaga silvatica]|uniref:FecR family protein n=1 Tax=Chitinophaga silvatica TaxID=2282649 RepID=A0A3E1Y5Y4_9BACT|nr:FecR family protein [Chitinophaga silvatica]RFS20122.1 FecR family protein [Chitinophaga silvatica]
MSKNNDHLHEEWQDFNEDDVPKGMDWDENYHSIRHLIHKDRKKQLRIRYVSIAFAGIFIISCTWAYFFAPPPEQPKFASVPAVKLLRNTSDTISRFRLADSTLVALYPHSMLIFSTDYNQVKRELYLDGIGEFDVHKDHSRPFIVYADNITVKAIGTRFLVKNVKEEVSESVLLEEGIVQVTDRVVQQSPKLLAVNDLFIWNRSASTMEIINKNKNTKPMLATAKKETLAEDRMIMRPTWFSFDNAALPVILDRLSELYGQPIRFKKSDLANLHFIGKFDKNDSLEHIIQVITSLNELKYKKKDDGTYLIYK